LWQAFEQNLDEAFTEFLRFFHSFGLFCGFFLGQFPVLFSRGCVHFPLASTASAAISGGSGLSTVIARIRSGIAKRKPPSHLCPSGR
jgi:hypothetical protein